MKYTMYENNKKIYSDKYLLSKKDIFGIEYIHKLIDIGVTSLKIEGRSKTPEYVGLVTDKYRKCIDNGIDNKDKKELKQIFIRTSESAGYFSEVPSIQSISENSAKNTGLKLGIVLEVRSRYIKIRLEENIDLHDGIEVYSKDNVVSTIVTCIKDEKFTTVNTEKESSSIVWLGDISKTVNVGDVVYKTSSNKLNQRYKDKLTKTNRKTLISGNINILKDTKINMDVKIGGKEINISIDYIPQISVNKPVDSEYIYNQLSKTIESSFEFENINYNIDANLFVPVSKLNELRRDIISKLEEAYLINIDVTKNYERLNEYITDHNTLLSQLRENKSEEIKNNSLFIYKYNIKEENKYISDCSDIVYLNISDIRRYETQSIDIVSKFIDKKKVYVYIPNVVLSNLDKYIDSNLERIIKLGVKGILLGNIGYIQIVKNLKSKYDLTVVADHSLNIVNTHAVTFLIEEGINKVTISPEIDESEIRNIEGIVEIELIENFVTAMTSRFCPVKAYSKKCNCNNNLYELKDNYNNIRYNVICDNTDCTVKLVRDVTDRRNSLISKRKCII